MNDFNLRNIKKKKILCIFSKYAFGDSKLGLGPEYNNFYKSIKNIFYNVKFFNSYNLKKKISETNSELYNFCKKYKPDIIFMSIVLYEIYTDNLERIKKDFKPIIINWHPDDSWRYEQHSTFFLDYLDCAVTTYKSAHQNNLRKGFFSIRHSWGCPDHWLGLFKNSNNCKIDILFIGKRYMDRENFIKKLKILGFNVVCYGDGWDNGPILDSKVSKLIQNSRITLNFSSSRGSAKQTKARVFEVTGAGGFCLSEHSDDLGDFFKIGKELDVFYDYKDMIKKIRFYLKNPSKRDSIAKQGNIKCKKFYAYSSIVKDIFYRVNKKYFLHKKNLNSENFNNKEEFLIYKNSNVYTFLKFYKFFSLLILNLFFSRKKSLKISRRVLFEIEIKLRKEKTYSSKGWCSNLFNLV
jgi:spore maturation protein CgeB